MRERGTSDPQPYDKKSSVREDEQSKARNGRIYARLQEYTRKKSTYLRRWNTLAVTWDVWGGADALVSLWDIRKIAREFARIAVAATGHAVPVRRKGRTSDMVRTQVDLGEQNEPWSTHGCPATYQSLESQGDFRQEDQWNVGQDIGVRG